MKNFIMVSERLKRIKKAFSPKIFAKFIFVFTGVASTLWFLIRVIPKPQRAGYPCMKAAAPIMSGFVIYLVTLSGFALLFKRAFSKFRQARYKSAIIAIITCFILVIVYSVNDAKRIFASTTLAPITPITWDTILPDGANHPMGRGVGVFPGRVVWSWNPNATKVNLLTGHYRCIFHAFK